MKYYERVWGKDKRDYGFEDHTDDISYLSVEDMRHDLEEDDEIIIDSPLVAFVFNTSERIVVAALVAEDAMITEDQLHDKAKEYEQE